MFIPFPTVDYNSPILHAAVALILLRWGTENWLDGLNERHVRKNADRVPEGLAGVMDEETYARSVEYTLAKIRFGKIENLFDTGLLLAVLLSGVLPWLFQRTAALLGESVWAGAACMIAVMVAMSVVRLPLDWRAQFRLEARFGFNTSTQGVWWLDRLKGAVLLVVLLSPVFALLLKLVELAGGAWWIWGWACLLGIQFLLMILAPIVILPLFNKFTPLEDGALKDRLLALAEKTQFDAREIQVMDGSRRSKHSNAFFTGFGKGRRIVLFDTLIEQLDETELEAVLAHEIGHYKRRHILKMMAVSAVGLFVGFWVLSFLTGHAPFLKAFGFDPGAPAPAFLLFGLLSGAVEFWLSPLLNRLSRQHEYEADAYARQAVGAARPLSSALRKLHEKNLGNLTPHPAYSGFHYSHPTLLEREAALAGA